MTISELANKATCELPQGWILLIRIWQGKGTLYASVERACHDEVYLKEWDDLTLEENCIAAINYAKMIEKAEVSK